MHRKIYGVTELSNLYDLSKIDNIEDEIFEYFLNDKDIMVKGEKIRQIVIGDKRIQNAIFINDFGGNLC